jgi:hypothetical protein
VAPGAAGLFPDPSGRLLLVPEPAEGRLTVIDLGRGMVAHRVPLEGRPLRVGFSRGQAYVQREGSPQISLIALGSLVEGGTPAIAGIAVGDAGLAADAALGATIAIAPGDGATLIAAPGEQAVHVYMEGMAAPSGALRTPQSRPLAIMAVDRGLRETAPGQYETQTVFPATGRYVVPVMQQGGGFLHCFEVELPGEAVAPQPLAQRLGLELAGPEGRVVPLDDSPAMLRVRLRGPAAEGAWREAGDVVARVVQFAGHWQAQLPMRPLGDGLYEAAVTPPRPGPMNLYVESASLGLQPGTLPHIMLRAVAP